MTDAFLTTTPFRLRQRLDVKSGHLLVVVFSQVRVPDGKFGLDRLFARTQHSCLFLNDPDNSWYLGLDDSIDRAVEAAVTAIQPQKIIYYGSSMGGYGALATGLRRQDGAVYAFGPELELGRPGSQSAGSGISQDRHMIQGTPGQASPNPVHLFYGICDPIDAFHAARIADILPTARRHLIWSSHASHDHLYSLNVIRRLIMTFARDPEVELASKNLLTVIDDGTLHTFGRYAEALVSGGMVTPADVESLCGYADNPGMIQLAAEAAVQAGDTVGAVERLEQAELVISRVPVLMTIPKRWRKELPLRRVELLMTLGETDRARDLLAETVLNFPIDLRTEQLGLRLGLALGPATG